MQPQQKIVWHLCLLSRQVRNTSPMTTKRPMKEQSLLSELCDLCLQYSTLVNATMGHWEKITICHSVFFFPCKTMVLWHSLQIFLHGPITVQFNWRSNRVWLAYLHATRRTMINHSLLGMLKRLTADCWGRSRSAGSVVHYCSILLSMYF